MWGTDPKNLQLQGHDSWYRISLDGNEKEHHNGDRLQEMTWGCQIVNTWAIKDSVTTFGWAKGGHWCAGPMGGSSERRGLPARQLRALPRRELSTQTTSSPFNHMEINNTLHRRPGKGISLEKCRKKQLQGKPWFFGITPSSTIFKKLYRSPKDNKHQRL